jgi:site-specific DNA recombinase
MKVSKEVKDYEGMKAFLIARVSDPRQTDALPAQEIRLNEYSDRYKFDKELYSFDETAFKEDRAKFIEIVDEVIKYHKYFVMMFDKIDRLTRDVSSDIVRTLKNLVKEGRCELHFPSDGLIYHQHSPAHDKTRLDMGMVFGGYYSMAISDNVKRKIEQKLHDGEYPGKACVGYKNIKWEDSNGKVIKDIIPDSHRKDYIIKAFDLRLEGKSYRTIAKILREEGFRSNTKKQGIVGQSQIETMLKNPFYYGVMKYDGELYPHKYEPVISKRTFDKVQTINSQRTNDKTKTSTKQVFIFSGILKCATCGCTISSYEQKGHVYMRCTKAKVGIICDQPHVAEADILPQVTELLEKLNISEGIVKQVLELMKSQHDNIQLFYRNAISQTQAEYKRLELRISTLYEDRLDGRITTNDYDKYVTKYKSEMEDLDRKLMEYTDSDKSFELTSSYLLELASKAKQLFESSQPEQKNNILRLLLANPTLRAKKLQLPLLKPFANIYKYHKTQNWLRGPGSNRRPIG